MSTKNLPPTPKRLIEARKRGDVPRVRDLVALCSGCALGIAVAGGGWYLLQLIGRGFDVAFAGAATADRAQSLPVAMAFAGLWAAPLAALVLVPAIGAAFVGRILSGRVWAFEQVAPKLERVSPLAGLKRLVSADSWLQVAKGALNIAIATAAGYFALRMSLEMAPRFALVDSRQALSLVVLPAIKVGTWWLVGMLVIALADVFIQRALHRHRLRMDLNERREEQRSSEGSPEVKGHRARAHRDLAR